MWNIRSVDELDVEFKRRGVTDNFKVLAFAKGKMFTAMEKT